MVYQVLARKWRPRHFKEVVGQWPVVQALRNALNQQYLHHAYLFTGTRGVGKTTISRILAKCLNCEKGVSANPCNKCNNCHEIDVSRFPDLFEVDAASRTKVEDTRELLENIQYTPTKGRFKVYLIDEAHMLSSHSFNALLKTLEEPPVHVKFILATTDHHKLPITVLSRCLQFHLTQLFPSQIAAHCCHVLQEEKIEFETKAIDLLARTANGSIRDALSLLDQGIAYGNGKIITEDMKIMLRMIEPTLLFNLLDALALRSGNHLLKCINEFAQQGVDFSNVLSDLLSLLHQITVLQIVPDVPMENNNNQLQELAKKLSCEDVQLFYQIGLIGQRDLPYSPSAQTGFEMTLLRMLAFYTDSKETLQTCPIASTTQKSETPWHQLLPQLNLTGAALALAQQCSFKEMTETELHLTLHSKQKPLLRQKQIERISEALSKLFNRFIRIKIHINDHQCETPAIISRKKTQDRLLKAEKTLINDEQVQRIIQAFDAKLLTESIVPHEK
ncbi:DNA polymerase III subunit gamma/tau [Coxiella endosymbiont of Amblyomma nuttalli]|uniref:DNA polymerase III subunit gamma/tau n=1 Tax=Coxiella endosymbiont of Amblyomma nuttalli TaxID=2749996 RepID=UPI001BABA6A8|nr:DNA polymerase III subunit gamma/tau [Coxiella endosymbiont of Amblyomma nuttalli]QTS84153.1 DNA polymerase III subunit tau [Coxiella endosymbiont of Amblyomma nuttalli]